MTLREEFIMIFKRNKDFIFEFLTRYKYFLEKTNYWNKRVFNDADVTHEEYYQTLVRVSNQEYSEEQYEAIKTVNIDNRDLADYINSLNIQYENLKIIFMEIQARGY